MAGPELFLRLWVAMSTRLNEIVAEPDRERGDVPGWVMITVMTAALVVASLAVAKQPITDAVKNAINSVTDAK
ncbi:MAG: hypothetical protein NVSMB13_04670 [Mycobacteriales bacterium]